MAGFENDVMLAKNMNFDEAAAKPHLGVINAAGKLPIGTGNTFPTPEILGGSITSTTLSIGYSSPNITVNTAGGGAPIERINGDTGFVTPTSGVVTLTAGTTGLSFTGSGSTMTMSSPELNLPDTTSSTVGVVNINGNRFMHKYGDADNVFVGTNAGNFTNVTALANTAVGSGALTALTTGDNCVAIGKGALAALTTSNAVTSIGRNAMTLAQTGCSNTTAIGNAAFSSYVSGAGSNSVFIGYQCALSWTSSSQCTLIGASAGQTGVGGGANSTGVGFACLALLTSGQQNNAFGAGSLSNLTTGNGNCAWGYQAGQNYTSSESYNVLINNLGTVGESNVCRIGASTGTGSFQLNSTFIHGINGVTSSNPLMVTINSSTSQLGVAAVPVTSTAWSVITANQTAAVNNGYICNKAGTLALALPATAAIGSIIEVTGINTALGWQITQATGQQIFFGTSSTTSGATGTITSSATRDSIKMVCVVANTTWNIISSIGSPTIV